jgi:hypothetical protein
MKFKSIAGILLVAWSGMCVGSDAQYTLPVSKAKGDNGYPLYLDDATIKSLVPDLADVGARRSTCANSMMIPPRLWIAFEPEVTGPHTAVLHTLECRFEDHDAERELSGVVRCTAHVDDTIGFAEDPHRFFSMQGTGGRAKALELFQAFFSGQVRFAEGSEKPEMEKVRDVHMVQESEDEFTIRWGDCGCTFSVRAQRETNDSWRAADRGGICV